MLNLNAAGNGGHKLEAKSSANIDPGSRSPLLKALREDRLQTEASYRAATAGGAKYTSVDLAERGCTNPAEHPLVEDPARLNVEAPRTVSLFCITSGNRPAGSFTAEIRCKSTSYWDMQDKNDLGRIICHPLNLILVRVLLQDDVRHVAKPSSASEKGIDSLLTLGFSKDQAERALRITQGNIERAANWLLQWDLKHLENFAETQQLESSFLNCPCTANSIGELNVSRNNCWDTVLQWYGLETRSVQSIRCVNT